MKLTHAGTILDECDLHQALRDVRRYLEPTPLIRHPLLDQELGMRAYVKLENSTPVGAFKLRGALHLVASLDDDERSRGLCAPTRGNHGQALAWAAREASVPCTLFVPAGNNPEKNEAMRAMGADLITAGTCFDETVMSCERFAQEHGTRLVHPGREPRLVAGAATLFHEMLEQAPEALDAVIVPVGVGGCISGAALVMRELCPRPQLIGVQSAAAPAMTLSWRAGRAQAQAVSSSLADGLSVGVPIEETLAVMSAHVDQMLLVGEQELERSMRIYARSMHQLAEGAGAAALAGALRLKNELEGAAVGIVLSGGNLDTSLLQNLFQ